MEKIARIIFKVIEIVSYVISYLHAAAKLLFRRRADDQDSNSLEKRNDSSLHNEEE